MSVADIEDQHQFILYHRIIWQGSDGDHAVLFIVETQQLFPELLVCSFDRGFHSPDNQHQLGELLDECALPHKGYLSVKALTHQSQQRFQAARQKRLGIESAINHLEHCGLDRVRDHGRSGSARAVALSVLVANLKRLGRILRDQERKKLARRQRLKAA